MRYHRRQFMQAFMRRSVAQHNATNTTTEHGVWCMHKAQSCTALHVLRKSRPQWPSHPVLPTCMYARCLHRTTE
eukprot:11067887-Alexandrium_andersonii.AAC.1